MGKLSNIFGVLALLLAGAAAFFSFTISQRRTEFRLRADTLATTMAEIVAAVDSDSGTALASEIDFTAGDPEAGTKGEGALSAIKFHEAKDDSGAFPEFDDLLLKAATHVDSLATQRNELADMLSATATTLALPEGQVEVAALRDLSDPEVFASAAEKIQSHVAERDARDQAMLAALTAAAKEIGEPIDEEALTSRKESQDDEGEMELGEYACKPTLEAFEANVSGLNERASAYVQALALGMDKVATHDGVFEWSFSKASIQSKDKGDYDGALTEMINDLGKLNEQLDNLVAARTLLVEKKQQIDQLETDLTASQGSLKEAVATVAAQKAAIRTLRKQLDIPDDDTTTIAAKPIEGEVKRVDSEFNYVILNIGKLDRLEEGTEMLVARGNEYIARVRVAKVLNNISVADILPLAMNGTVKPEDRVIMVTEPKPRQLQ